MSQESARRMDIFWRELSPEEFERTLKALLESIEKWSRIVAGVGRDFGPNNCALCQQFHNGDEVANDCLGCPVRKFTRERYCSSTPYMDWDAAGGHRTTADTPRRKRDAEAELAFLRSLLPDAARKAAEMEMG